MKAVVVDKFGSDRKISLAVDLKNPTLDADHVIVTVHAASINPFDNKLIGGNVPIKTPPPFPKIIGMDLAGTVAEVNPGSNLKVGDEVFGQADFFGGGGSIAEMTTAKPSSLAIKPKNTSFIEAASLPLVSSAAYQAIVDNLHISLSQKILIHGGAGGIGSIAIQLAKHLGAYVTTTVSSNDIVYASELGADQVVDYKTEDFSKKLSGYDAVLDLIGGESYTKSFAVLKTGGVIVSTVEQPDQELADKLGVRSIHLSAKVDSPTLAKVAELVEAGAILPQIGKVFPLTQAADAFDFLDHGHSRGKVIVDITT